MSTSNERLDRLEVIVERNSEAIEKLAADLTQLTEDVKRWDERFFQLSQDNLSIARTIIITAGAVVILSPLLKALASVLEMMATRLLEGH